jgi:hypothetical protein
MEHVHSEYPGTRALLSLGGDFFMFDRAVEPTQPL